MSVLWESEWRSESKPFQAIDASTPANWSGDWYLHMKRRSNNKNLQSPSHPNYYAQPTLYMSLSHRPCNQHLISDSIPDSLPFLAMFVFEFRRQSACHLSPLEWLRVNCAQIFSANSRRCELQFHFQLFGVTISLFAYRSIDHVSIVIQRVIRLFGTHG